MFGFLCVYDKGGTGEISLKGRETVYMSLSFVKTTATTTEACADSPLLRDLHHQRYILRTKAVLNNNEWNLKKQTIFLCRCELARLRRPYSHGTTQKKLKGYAITMVPHQ
jgi:hypothetical protein